MIRTLAYHPRARKWGCLQSPCTTNAIARCPQIGYPLFVKAVAGGGGKGMRTVTDPAELAGATKVTSLTGFGAERWSQCP